MSLITMIIKMSEGLGKTCAIFFLTLLFSLPLGMVVALLRMSKIKIVSAITRTQAYTTGTCMAFRGVTDLPALLPPNEKVVAALTTSRGLSRARNSPAKGFFISASEKINLDETAVIVYTMFKRGGCLLCRYS